MKKITCEHCGVCLDDYGLSSSVETTYDYDSDTNTASVSQRNSEGIVCGNCYNFIDFTGTVSNDSNTLQIDLDDVGNMVVDIIDCFAEILERNNIMIPDRHREGNDDESPIYGETFYFLEEEVRNAILHYSNLN